MFNLVFRWFSRGKKTRSSRDSNKTHNYSWGNFARATDLNGIEAANACQMVILSFIGVRGLAQMYVMI